MRIWTEGGFFQNVKGHVLKWWQFVVHSVLRINNNQPKGQGGRNVVIPNQEETVTKQPEMVKEQTKTDDRSELARQRAAQVRREKDDEIRSMFSKMGKEDGKPSGGTAPQDGQDPMEVLKRIKQDKEGFNSKEIEEARRQAQEQERIATIMNANQVNLKAFIEAGKASREAVKASSKQEAMSEEELQKQEEMRRAQEIIDRLNREAAEDEAKKQAQIEEAKKKTKETFVE